MYLLLGIIDSFDLKMNEMNSILYDTAPSALIVTEFFTLYNNNTVL